MSRRKPVSLPKTAIHRDQPCKNGQPFVAADGSCLRCGADQGVRGYACNEDEVFLGEAEEADELEEAA